MGRKSFYIVSKSRFSCMQVVSVLQDQQVLLARVEREAQASLKREQATLKIVGDLKQEICAVKQVLIAMLSSEPPSPELRGSSSAARFGSSSRRCAPTQEQQRTAAGFFAWPPSAPVAAAAEAALRAAAQSTAQRAEAGDPTPEKVMVYPSRIWGNRERKPGRERQSTAGKRRRNSRG
jgi:hypothetical protein